MVTGLNPSRTESLPTDNKIRLGSLVKVSNKVMAYGLWLLEGYGQL